MNAIISSAASISTSDSTEHPLSGQAEEIYLSRDTTAGGFYFVFSSVATTNATGMAFVQEGNEVIIPAPHPTYMSIVSEAGTGYVHIVEYF
jgi:hypothetical protein